MCEMGTPVKKSKAYSINCNPFSRAMVSPLSTEDPTPGELISSRLASSLSDIPNSLPKSRKDSLPSLFVAAYRYEYLSTLDSTDHDVVQDTGCVKPGLSWHGIYFAFTLCLST